MVSLLTTLKSLPIAYNKDLQEDKEGLFDSLKTVKISLKITDKFLQSIKINGERMKKATETGFLNATDAADFLVKKGVSFRDAYKSVGEAVAFCVQNSKNLENLTTEQWQSFHKAFSDKVKDAIKIKNCLYNRTSFGGTSPTKVREQITEGWERLKK
jgi:argininosuccinate lyase